MLLHGAVICLVAVSMYRQDHPVNLPSVTVNGVTLMVTENNNTTCFNSTLTFTGNLSSLTALDDRTLSCFFSGDPTDTITISVPSEYQAVDRGVRWVRTNRPGYPTVHLKSSENYYTGHFCLQFLYKSIFLPTSVLKHQQ